MALSKGQGAEMSAPIGVTLAAGLTSTTILTLFIVPVLYSIVDRISYKARAKTKKILHGEIE